MCIRDRLLCDSLKLIAVIVVILFLMIYVVSITQVVGSSMTVSYTHLDVYKRQGLLNIFKGIGQGIGQMFNFVNYITVINDYKSDLTGVEMCIRDRGGGSNDIDASVITSTTDKLSFQVGNGINIRVPGAARPDRR